MARTMLRTDRNGVDPASSTSELGSRCGVVVAADATSPVVGADRLAAGGRRGAAGCVGVRGDVRAVSVMVAAHDIEPGEVIDAADLQVVEIGVEQPAAGGAAEPAGPDRRQAARGPIPAGTVLNTDLFADRDQTVPAGMVVVGAALEQGAAPTSSLRAGDRVDVLGVVRTTGAPADGREPVGCSCSRRARCGRSSSRRPDRRRRCGCRSWCRPRCRARWRRRRPTGLLRLSLVGSG